MRPTPIDEAKLPAWRKFVCGVVITVLPSALMGQNSGSGAGMLHHQGGVFVNHSLSPNSTALFFDDLIETQTGFEAKLDVHGSTATIHAESMLQFEDNDLNLDHGVVSVTTAHRMTVRVGCLTARPVEEQWTNYDVSYRDGKIVVTADKDDVEVESKSTVDRKKDDPPHRDVVREGEQKSFDDKCALAEKTIKHVQARGPILSSPWVKWPTAVGIGVMTCLIVCRDMSPSNPDDGKSKSQQPN